MALIPNDVGIRMRLQAENSLLQPLQHVLEIPSDLPELRPGQTFSARIQEVLPENTYKALVAGKSLTLALPEGAKAGDTLELVVIDRSPKVVVAQLAAQNGVADAAEPYQYATLSRTAQLISTLLPADGEAAAPVTLNRGQPLLPAPPLAGSQLAPVLADAVKQSGLFYEAHQAQWIQGRLPLPQLLLEPQASHSNFAVLMASVPPEQQAAVWTSAQNSALAGRRDEAPTLPQALLGRTSAVNQGNPGAATANGAQPSNLAALQATGNTSSTTGSPSPSGTPSATGQGIPDDLRPIVQQQLDAVATQRLAWHGEVWPDQRMDWEIDWQGERQGAGDGQPETWGTTLSLTTPRLGEVQARLQLTAEGVRIAITTPYGATAADLRDAAPQLENSLAAAGVPLLGLLVRHDTAP